MENSEIFYGSMLSSGSFKGSENLGNDSAFYEKFLLEDLDSYWDDLNARLTVSRMVSDSVIKGMVNAVVEEAAERITSKEAEMDILKGRLQLYECDAAKDKEFGLSMMQVKRKEMGCIDSSVERSHAEHLENLKAEAEKQLWKLQTEIEDLRSMSSIRRTKSSSGDVGMCNDLYQGKVPEELVQMEKTVDSLKVMLAAIFRQVGDMVSLVKDSVYEQQWRLEFQQEVDTIMIQNFIRGLWEEFETKLCEQGNLLNNQNKNLLRKVDLLSGLRLELDAISRSLFSSEPVHLLSHGSHENFEGWNTVKRKDHLSRKALLNHTVPGASHTEENDAISMEKSEKPMLEVAESPHLRHMPKEELISYYKTEITKMKRQHESSLHQATEELFSLKRDLLNLKEKGSSTSRKDKDFEILKKKIPEFIIKLDDVLMENDKFSMVQDDLDNLCSYKDRIDNLLWENQRLQGLLIDKKKEVRHLSSQVSDAANQMSHFSSAESNFLQQTRKLKVDVEDVKIEAAIREEIYKTVLRELTGEVRCNMEDIEMVTAFIQDIYTVMLRDSVADARSSISPITMKYDEEKRFLEAGLLEKENTLSLVVEERENLQQIIASLSTMLEEKNKFASDAGITLMQQKENLELVCLELNMLRDQVSKQERLSLENRRETDLVKARLEETSNDLKEAVKQKNMLHDIIQEKQATISSAVAKEEDQIRQMESIIISVKELAQAVAEFESRLIENIIRNDSRLGILSYQCKPLIQQASFLRRKELLYVQNLDNLQKAEIEVDLLGDEVDALLSLLEKIYIALDHYSPVLQHYPGVMEILKLIKRELKGNW